MSENDRAGLSTVGRILPTGQPTHAPVDSAAHDELIDQLVRRLGRWLLGKLRPWLGHLLVFGGGFGANQYINASGTASDEPTEQRDHAASGPSPEQPVPHPVNPELADELDRCKSDTRLAIDTCVEQAKACGAKDVPRPSQVPNQYEKTP